MKAEHYKLFCLESKAVSSNYNPPRENWVINSKLKIEKQ